MNVIVILQISGVKLIDIPYTISAFAGDAQNVSTIAILVAMFGIWAVLNASEAHTTLIRIKEETAI